MNSVVHRWTRMNADECEGTRVDVAGRVDAGGESSFLDKIDKMDKMRRGILCMLSSSGGGGTLIHWGPATRASFDRGPGKHGRCRALAGLTIGGETDVPARCAGLVCTAPSGPVRREVHGAGKRGLSRGLAGFADHRWTWRGLRPQPKGKVPQSPFEGGLKALAGLFLLFSPCWRGLQLLCRENKKLTDSSTDERR